MCFTQSWTLGVTNWRWYKTWGDDCVTYSVFYTKLDARCDKLALVVMKTARLLRLLRVARRVDQYSEYGTARRPAGDRRPSWPSTRSTAPPCCCC